MAVRRGKPEAFTEAENAALSSELRGLIAKHGWTQGEAGARLGVNQQNAGKLAGGRQGFSRPTAVKLAALCGWDGPESMLRDLGVKAEARDAPKGWPARDIAVSSARRIGYPEVAIESVVARYASTQYANRPSVWWMDRIVATAHEFAAEPEPPPPSGTSLDVTSPAEQPRLQKRAR